MKWDPDKSLLKLEAALGLGPGKAPGTAMTRVSMSTDVMKREGVAPKPDQTGLGYGMVWCIALGQMNRPKEFFYGHTLRQAYLRARRVFRPLLTKVQREQRKDRKKKSR